VGGIVVVAKRLTFDSFSHITSEASMQQHSARDKLSSLVCVELATDPCVIEHRVIQHLSLTLKPTPRCLHVEFSTCRKQHVSEFAMRELMNIDKVSTCRTLLSTLRRHVEFYMSPQCGRAMQRMMRA